MADSNSLHTVLFFPYATWATRGTAASPSLLFSTATAYFEDKGLLGELAMLTSSLCTAEVNVFEFLRQTNEERSAYKHASCFCQRHNSDGEIFSDKFDSNNFRAASDSQGRPPRACPGRGVHLQFAQQLQA